MGPPGKAGASALRRLTGGEARAVLEAAQLGASVLFILLYVWSTYVPEAPGSWRYWLDLGLCAFFFADYVYRITAGSGGRHPLRAALHPLNLIDLLSFVPSLTAVNQLTGVDLRWFRIFRALRLLRLSLLEGNLPHMRLSRGALLAGAVNVPLLWLVASVCAWLFTSAAMVQVIEKMPFHDAVYFITTTLTTVGYGDVVVKSSIGRLAVLVMMLVGVVLIPARASQLYSRFSERRTVAGPIPTGRRPFVIFSGKLSDVRGFNDFFSSILTQIRLDGSERWRQLQMVCLTDHARPEFLALQELYERQLTLIEGSALWEPDLLGRARLPLAEAAMVLADRFSSDAEAEDTDVQFRVWAMKSVTKKVPLYVQVLQLSSVTTIAPFLDPARDVVTSLEQTRHRLLALNCLAPGASTLITNLLRCTGQKPRG
ncbi:Potassium channel subfamily T member 2, partial [Monoraphidium neglectum]